MSGPDYFKNYIADELVAENQETYYFRPGDEGLYLIHEVHSLGYHWDLIHGWDNSKMNSDYDTRIEYTHTTRVMNSSQDEISGKVGLQLKGLSFEIGGTHMTISENEITEERKETTDIKVEAGKKLYFYKKVYRFRIKTWFINDAWGERWRVGGYGNYSPCTVENIVEHDTKNHLRVPDELRNSTKTTVVGKTPQISFYKTRKFENCTRQCKHCISVEMKIQPPHSTSRILPGGSEGQAIILTDQGIIICEHNFGSLFEPEPDEAAMLGNGKCNFMWGGNKRCPCNRFQGPSQPKECGNCSHSFAKHQ